MPKKITPYSPIKFVSCSDCIHKQIGEHPAVMWCDKIRMPRPSEPLKQCIYKIKK